MKKPPGLRRNPMARLLSDRRFGTRKERAWSERKARDGERRWKEAIRLLRVVVE